MAAPETPAPPAQPAPPPPERYQASKATLLVDKFMTHFIKVGGIMVIGAVMAIFVFIFIQVLPLFKSAAITPLPAVELGPAALKAQVLGVDEWSALPFLAQAEGKVKFVPITDAGVAAELTAELDGVAATAIRYQQRPQKLIYGLADGRFALVQVKYESIPVGRKPQVSASLRTAGIYELGVPGHPVQVIDYADDGALKLAAAIQLVDGTPRLVAMPLTQSRGLGGAGKVKAGERVDLSEAIKAKPVLLRVGDQANTILVADEHGRVHYFKRQGDEFSLRQSFKPFPAEDETVASLDFVFGGVSLVLTSTKGAGVIYTIYMHENEGELLFAKTKDLPSMAGGATAFAPSLRNKAFLLTHDNTVALRYATTASTRWEGPIAAPARLAVLSGKYDQILVVDTHGTLERFTLDDPHPEAGIRAFFGKLWYEGNSAPSYDWQSTGGTDDYEPKLSMIPLIIGSLKGTLYAMLFATPIALLAALYTSQFQHPRFRGYVKPTMEVMASLPSVVLGFLAALWLAPVIETRVPTVICFMILAPLAVTVIGWIWSALPIRYRFWCKPGYEFLLMMPVVLLLIVVADGLAPVLERLLFVVKDPDTGLAIADFRRWWPEFTGARFEQRNALVVGFIMGFAVIPIIFTIAEDSLSGVPKDIVSASLALGASRWQTAIRVVLPTASAGVFSALMIGFGRAVGETMIVLMATGNTAVLDFNMFSGFRTLSANIAVELPEAPHHSTLYRALFLGALLLFFMTFAVNTVAEVLRQHLRRKYRTV